jgi:succinylarginine dihydrolase
MTDTVEAYGTAERADVTSAVDTIDGRRHLVLADITADDTWLAMASSETVSVESWR